MRRLQGESGHRARGNTYGTRDTTRGNSDTIFPSMSDTIHREKLFPATCEICGIQCGFSATENSIAYCSEWHMKFGMLIEKFQSNKVSPSDK